jgi:hypothetical protein
MRNLLLVTMLAAACGGSSEPLVRHPRGYAAHMEAADVHSQRAEQHREIAAQPDSRRGNLGGYNCGDTALTNELTSGGERLVQSVPCWDVAEETAEHQRYLALREERRARTERRIAASLVENELAACRGLSERELEHSPFAHRKEIAAVIAHRETGTLRGVRVVFKPVPGLTAAWMRQAIACHRARFERLGEPAGYLPDDPTLVAHATATVDDREGHLVVLIEADDSTAAQVAFDRAHDLLRPQTANR